MAKQKNKKVVFKKNTSPIISEIFKSRNIDQVKEGLSNLEEYCDRGGVLLRLTIKLVKNNISEEELPSQIQKQAKVSKNKAEKLAKDIKEKLLPLANLKDKKERTKKQSSIPKNKPSKQKPTILKQKKETKSSPPQKNKTTKKDPYRESLE